MNGNGPLREDRTIEYRIRKYQRALSVIQRVNYEARSNYAGASTRR